MDKNQWLISRQKTASHYKLLSSFCAGNGFPVKLVRSDSQDLYSFSTFRRKAKELHIVFFFFYTRISIGFYWFWKRIINNPVFLLNFNDTIRKKVVHSVLTTVQDHNYPWVYLKENMDKVADKIMMEKKKGITKNFSRRMILMQAVPVLRSLLITAQLVLTASSRPFGNLKVGGWSNKQSNY